MTSELVLDRRLSQLVDRWAWERYGLAGVVLMENAGRGVADRLLTLGAKGKIAVCCGKGNNGGDGFVIARHLEGHGLPVRVLVWGDPEQAGGDAAINFQILLKAGIPVERCGEQFDRERIEQQLQGAEWIVDALLGTGARGEPREPLGRVIELVNSHPAKKLAVDLPSGLDCDTGEAAQQTIRADETCTFVSLKPGLIAPGAEQYTGRVTVLPLGLPRKLQQEIAAEILTEPEA